MATNAGSAAPAAADARSADETPRFGPFDPTLTALAIAVWAALVLASAADWWTTAIGLQMGFVESNPGPREIIHTYGFAGFAVAKVGALVVVALGTAVLSRWNVWVALYLPALGGAFTALAAFTNALAIAGVIGVLG